MRKTRKAAAVLTAVAMAAVSAAPVMADEIKVCMIMSFSQERWKLGIFCILRTQPILMY